MKTCLRAKNKGEGTKKKWEVEAVPRSEGWKKFCAGVGVPEGTAVCGGPMLEWRKEVRGKEQQGETAML